MEIRTEIQIDAPAVRVWSILTRFEEYPAWNPYIRSIEGTARIGETLRIRLEPPGVRVMTLRPRVLNVVPARELRWLAQLLLPGLLDGEHVLSLEPLDSGSVRFVNRERFIGLAALVLGRRLETSITQGFAAMNTALKQRAERSAASAS